LLHDKTRKNYKRPSGGDGSGTTNFEFEDLNVDIDDILNEVDGALERISPLKTNVRREASRLAQREAKRERRGGCTC
jgi:hypothetical protein